jgi:hypothetical protein
MLWLRNTVVPDDAGGDAGDDGEPGDYTDVGGFGGDFQDAPDGLYSELETDFKEPDENEGVFDDFSDDEAYGDHEEEEEGYLAVGDDNAEDEFDNFEDVDDADDADDAGEEGYMDVDQHSGPFDPTLEAAEDYGFDAGRAIENPIYDAATQ